MEGKEVILVEKMDEIAPGMLLDNRNPLIFELEDYKVNMMPSSTIKEVLKDGVIIKKMAKK